MNPSAVLRSERLRPLTRLAAAWGVWAALGLASSSPLRAQSAGGTTPAGTVVTNEATVTYSTSNGNAIATVGSVSFIVGQVAGADVDPIRIAISEAGRDVLFSHTVRNIGNGTDSFDMVAASASGWSLLLHHDVDADGVLSAADTILTDALPLTAGASASLLLTVSVPATAGPGSIEVVTLTATSRFDVGASDAVADEVRLIDAGVDGEVDKVVDRTQAAAGDLLNYSIRVRVGGAGVRDSVMFEDRIPDLAGYESGTLLLDGVGLTDAPDADGGWYQPSTGTIRVDLSHIAPDTDATIMLQVRVDDDTPVGTRISNVGRLRIHTPAGTVEEVSPPATTQIAAPELRFTKSVSGLNPVTTGDTLVYTIDVTNPSATLAATGLAVVDTLSGALALDRTEPAATVSGQEVRWTLDRLEPGTTATFRIFTEVAEVTDTLEVTNRAHLSQAGAPDVFADSEARILMPEVAASMALTLETDVIEVQLGESLPLVASVVNDGPATVAEVLVKVAIPAGARFIEEAALSGSFAGARPSPSFATTPGGPALAEGDFGQSPLQIDSFAAVGDTLFVWLPGELRPDEAIDFRYTLMVSSAAEGVLLNRAIAEARRGTLFAVSSVVVASNQAQVLVGLTRNRALETRTVIGKVFHDFDGDGFQDEDEPGVPGVDIITADGEMVTTDAFGKLSFNNLRPGRHAFRIDPLSVPAGLVARTSGPGQRLQVLEINGWNSPRLVFALESDGTAAAVETSRSSEEGGGLPASDGSPAARGAEGDGSIAAPAATRSVADASQPEPVRVVPARTEDERDAEERAAFLRGPGIRIVDPIDGHVSATNRLYLGVQGEPLAPVALFRGDELLEETKLLPNGVGDFVGLELSAGPQLFRIRTTNTWGNVRWDSVTVHQSGRPVRIVAEDDRVSLVADGRTPAPTRVRLFDEWGVPVVHRPFVTVRADGATFADPDVDASSMGHQLRADADGWVTITLLGERSAGEGALLVEVPDAHTTVSLRILPPVRPLFLTGVGQVSLGSGPDAFGAVTAQGRLTDETALTLSYDSRRLDQGRDVFGRNFDPLEEGQQPILGDASVQRSLSSSRYRFSARIERELDYLMFGDVQTSGFSDGLSLARYGRSLPGAAARLTTGPVVWNAFGASTTQALRQQQVRGSGSSGPFELGIGVLPGTEEVRIQVRALDNPTRIVSEQLLTRYAEYQVDYVRGTLLLKQPVPAADVYGNPVFLLVTYEGETGGDRSPVWGVRASSDLGDRLGEVVDSVPVSISFVHDAQPGSTFRLGAFQTGLVQESGLELSAELALAEGADSSGVATRIRGAVPVLDGRVKLGAEWTRVGDEFTNPADIALRPGTSEVRATATSEVGSARVSATHERQSFNTRDLSRDRTTVGYAQEVIEDVEVEARLAGDGSSIEGEESSSAAGEYKVTWSATPRLDVFAEGRNELWSSGAGLANRGAYYGAGATFDLLQNFALEARHLRVRPTGDANPYGLTSIGLTSDLRVGTKAWGTYQISGGIDGQRNAAVVGLNHRFALGPSWRFSTMVERRQGVAGATLGDPVLASPFDQPEDNYVSASFGTEYVPEGKPYRMSMRAENRDGTLSTSRLATLAGDVAFGAGLGLLTRQEFIERDVVGSLTTRYTRERSSLWGLAYRPTQRDDLNILFKFGWKDAINPFGSGVLAADGEESRLIGAMEAIWAPRSDLELGGRFATRSTRLGTPLTDATTIITRNQTDFLGLRGRWYANAWAGAELEARGLMTALAPGAVWDVAPSLIARPIEAFEVELGYRFGDLQDPDFAVESGRGFFLTLGTRITEDAVGSAAAFWRSKFGGS